MPSTVHQFLKSINITTTETRKQYECAHCNKSYAKESTLAAHMCEQKRRQMAKTDQHVHLGYQVYLRFYELAQKVKNQKTYEEFARSSYYNAFVKFGSFLRNINPLYLDKYIDYVITSGVKLDNWCQEELYYRYITDLIKRESVDTALQRTITTMSNWANDHNSQWDEYFKSASINRVFYDIKDGKISPWLMLNCRSGRELLNKFCDQQLNLLVDIVDPAFWAKKFQQNAKDVEFVKQVCKNSILD